MMLIIRPDCNFYKLMRYLQSVELKKGLGEITYLLFNAHSASD